MMIRPLDSRAAPLRLRYFDMLKDIGSHPGTSTVFLPSDSAPVRDGIMQANAMAR